MKNIDWRLVALGVVLAIGVGIVSLIAFPEWAQSNRTLLLLVSALIVGVPQFIKNVRDAFRKTTQDKNTPANENIGQSGGANVNGDRVQAQDITGRDKIAPTIGAGAENVAVGQNITQNISHIEKQIVQTEAGRIQGARFSIPTPPRDFTGRAKEIDDLIKLLIDSKSPDGLGRAAISGLTGMGGVGKSTLASYVAQKVADSFPDAAMWIDLQGMDDKPLAPTDAMRQIILALNPTEDLRKATDAEIVQMYRAVLHGKRALIVLDNAKDAMQVRELLKAECAFIVTSRRQFVEQGLLLIRLDVLEEKDARELLKKLCVRLTDGELTELTELCGRLPLALRIAGSHLATRPNESAARYIEKLKAKRIEFLKDEDLDVEATFALTYDRLDPEMQRRWRFLAVFPAPFDLNAAAYVWKVDPDQAENSLGDLFKESLVEYGEGRYRLHDLLRYFARGR